MGTFVIAKLTFQEAARRRILLAALVFGLLFLVIYGLGFRFIINDVTAERGPTSLILNEMRNFLLMAGLYAVNFLTVMMTVLTSVDTLSGEVASGTIHTLLSKPIRRWEVVLGKWLGFSSMLTLYLMLMAGGVLALVYAFSGYTPNNALRGVGLMWMNAVLVLSVSLLGGSTLSTLANGVVAFGLFGMAFIGGWIERIGSFFENQTAINIGVISSLILPSEALWGRAVYEMRTPLATVVQFSPFAFPSIPSPMMVGYSVIYVVVVLWLTMRWFKARDL
jgi:Cu-processing system permease protein